MNMTISRPVKVVESTETVTLNIPEVPIYVYLTGWYSLCVRPVFRSMMPPGTQELYQLNIVALIKDDILTRTIRLAPDLLSDWSNNKFNDNDARLHRIYGDLFELFQRPEYLTYETEESFLSKYNSQIEKITRRLQNDN